MKNNNLFKRCPKSNRIVGINYGSKWFWYAFPVLAIFSLIWFLIRVIPKPSRIQYPCQKMAMSIFTGFFTYVAGVLGIGCVLKWIKVRISTKKFTISAAILSVVVIICMLVYTNMPYTIPAMSADSRGYVSYSPKDTAVMGIGKGVNPGRVVLTRNSDAVKYNGSGLWYSDSNTDPTLVSKIFKDGICQLAGNDDIKTSWDKLFLYHNGYKSAYTKGEKIVIKLNQNQDKGQVPLGKAHIATPQLVHALIDNLVNVVGANQGDITIMDASRSIGDELYNYITKDFSGIRFVAQNRIKPVRDENAIVHFSGGEIPDGCVSTEYVHANYLINFTVIRPHDMFGVTLCGKNQFGAVDFLGKNEFTPPSMHVTADNPCNNDKAYHPQVDLMGDNNIGGKTFLYMIDAFYGAVSQNGELKTNFDMFDGKTASGVFLSQDPVAIDSVVLDYLACEDTVSIRGKGSYYVDTPDNYLHEAAQYGNPPSKTVYNPNGDGIRPQSLGVHEHWNNSRDKQYSRNLGKNEGIEFIDYNTTPKSIQITYDAANVGGTQFASNEVITKSGTMTDTVHIKNTKGNAISPYIIVALYDEQTLISSKVVAVPSISVGDADNPIQITNTIPPNIKNGRLSVFIWTNMLTKPFANHQSWVVKN